MSFRKWLIRLLGGRPGSQGTTIARGDNEVAGGGSIITPSLPFTIPPAMINTLTFSTDLLQVHLINEDQLLSFKLASKNGVTIGLLDGQLAVVNPVRPGPGSVFTSGEEEDLPDPQDKKVLRLTLAENSQYSIGYNEKTQVLSLIGALDIISTITDPTPPTGTCDLHLFDLSGGQTVSIRRSRNILLVVTNPAPGAR